MLWWGQNWGNNMKICTLTFPIKGGLIYLAPRKHEPCKGIPTGYGGKLEHKDGRDVLRAAVREFNEESGAVTTPGDLEWVAVIDFFEAGQHRYQCYVYFCHQWEGTLRETEEMGRPEAHPIPLVPYSRMMAGDKMWLEKVLSGERIRAHCFYSEGNKELLDFKPGPLEL